MMYAACSVMELEHVNGNEIEYGEEHVNGKGDGHVNENEHEKEEEEHVDENESE